MMPIPLYSTIGHNSLSLPSLVLQPPPPQPPPPQTSCKSKIRIIENIMVKPPTTQVINNHTTGATNIREPSSYSSKDEDNLIPVTIVRPQTVDENNMSSLLEIFKGVNSSIIDNNSLNESNNESANNIFNETPMEDNPSSLPPARWLPPPQLPPSSFKSNVRIIENIMIKPPSTHVINNDTTSDTNIPEPSSSSSSENKKNFITVNSTIAKLVCFIEKLNNDFLLDYDSNLSYGILSISNMTLDAFLFRNYAKLDIERIKKKKINPYIGKWIVELKVKDLPNCEIVEKYKTFGGPCILHSIEYERITIFNNMSSCLLMNNKDIVVGDAVINYVYDDNIEKLCHFLRIDKKTLISCLDVCPFNHFIYKKAKKRDYKKNVLNHINNKIKITSQIKQCYQLINAIINSYKTLGNLNNNGTQSRYIIEPIKSTDNIAIIENRLPFYFEVEEVESFKVFAENYCIRPFEKNEKEFNSFYLMLNGFRRIYIVIDSDSTNRFSEVFFMKDFKYFPNLATLYRENIKFDIIVQKPNQLVVLEGTLFVATIDLGNNLFDYAIHPYSASGIKLEIYYCDDCNFSSSDRLVLNNHIKLTHSMIYKDCNICKKKINIIRFDIHQKYHEFIRSSCMICDKPLLSSFDYHSLVFSSLQFHFMIRHSLILPNFLSDNLDFQDFMVYLNEVIKNKIKWDLDENDRCYIVASILTELKPSDDLKITIENAKQKICQYLKFKYPSSISSIVNGMLELDEDKCDLFKDISKIIEYKSTRIKRKRRLNNKDSTSNQEQSKYSKIQPLVTKLSHDDDKDDDSDDNSDDDYDLDDDDDDDDDIKSSDNQIINIKEKSNVIRECPVCKKDLTALVAPNKHISGCGNYICPNCGKHYYNKTALKKHKCNKIN